MSECKAELAAMVGSRICHDLISPVGAIANGLELLNMSGTASGPEMDLISESVTNANARIRFFRIAFGQSGSEQAFSAPEAEAILSGVMQGGKIQAHWLARQGASRDMVQALFLAVLCLQSAMPIGGQIAIDSDDEGWRVTASAPRMSQDTAPWNNLLQGKQSDTVTPAMVQFALLPSVLSKLGRELRVTQAAESISLMF